MASLRNETILSVGLDMGPVSSQTTDHLPDPPSHRWGCATLMTTCRMSGSGTTRSPSATG